MNFSAPALPRCSLYVFAAIGGFVVACVAMGFRSDANPLALFKSASVDKSELPAGLWNQLASDDPKTFAANLQRIGCSAVEIEHIVARQSVALPAVVSSSSPPRGVDFEGTTPGTHVPSEPQSTASFAGAQPLLGGLAAVRRAQAMGSSRPAKSPAFANPAGAAVVADPVEATAPIVAPEGDVPLPVAFQPLPQDGKMNESKRQQLAAIQDEFVKNIGGSNQDPASPDYEARWRKAQRLSDEQYRVLFGVQAFLQRQIATAVADRASAGSDQ